MILSSPIWKQETDKSRECQYDYDAVKLFIKEALSVLTDLYKAYARWNFKFHQDDRSAAKAVWMLDMECIETLADAVDLLADKRHRVAGKLLRFALEAADLSALFWGEGDCGNNLKEWYAEKIIPHSRYRDFLEKKGRPACKAKRKAWYGELSNWMHHTHYAINNSYFHGGAGYIAHDGYCSLNDGRSTLFVTPETVYQCTWLVSVVISLVWAEMCRHGFVGEQEMADLRGVLSCDLG